MEDEPLFMLSETKLTFPINYFRGIYTSCSQEIEISSDQKLVDFHRNNILHSFKSILKEFESAYNC